jgi:hypothetical protein
MIEEVRTSQFEDAYDDDWENWEATADEESGYTLAAAGSSGETVVIAQVRTVAYAEGRRVPERRLE